MGDPGGPVILKLAHGAYRILKLSLQVTQYTSFARADTMPVGPESSRGRVVAELFMQSLRGASAQAGITLTREVHTEGGALDFSFDSAPCMTVHIERHHGAADTPLPRRRKEHHHVGDVARLGDASHRRRAQPLL